MDRLEEAKRKASLVRALLDEKGADAVLVRKQANFSWLGAGARGFIGLASETACGTLVVHRDGVVLASNNIESRRLLEEELPAGFAEPVELEWSADAGLEAAVRARFPRLVDDAALDSWFRERRVALTGPELDRYRTLGRGAAEALESACQSALPGTTEFAVAGAVARELWNRGIEPITVLVAADGRSERVRHYVPTGERARKGFIASVCARSGGLVASATRIVAFAPGFAAAFGEVAEVEREALDATEAGLPLGEVLRRMEDAYAANGLGGEWRNHHQGGLTGYLAREIRADRGCAVPAATDRAYAWNPSAPGAKCEDTVLLTAAGLEIATAAGPSWPQISVGGRARPAPLLKY